MLLVGTHDVFKYSASTEASTSRKWTSSNQRASKMLVTVLAALVCTVLAVPASNKARRQAGPSVTIVNGTVVGSTSNGVDSFKGIPFAQPPTGENRLKVPQPLATAFGSFDATGTPASCPGLTSQSNNTSLPSEAVGLLLQSPLFQAVQGTSEDCLTLNVQRPSSASADSLLPVVFWIVRRPPNPPYGRTDRHSVWRWL